MGERERETCARKWERGGAAQDRTGEERMVSKDDDATEHS